MVAALVVPDSEIVLSDVMTNPLRTGLIKTLREMGAQIDELTSAATPASRWRDFACARRSCAASRCRPSVRPR